MHLYSGGDSAPAELPSFEREESLEFHGEQDLFTLCYLVLVVGQNLKSTGRPGTPMKDVLGWFS